MASRTKGKRSDPPPNIIHLSIYSSTLPPPLSSHSSDAASYSGAYCGCLVLDMGPHIIFTSRRGTEMAPTYPFHSIYREGAAAGSRCVSSALCARGSVLVLFLALVGRGHVVLKDYGIPADAEHAASLRFLPFSSLLLLRRASLALGLLAAGTSAAADGNWCCITRRCAGVRLPRSSRKFWFFYVAHGESSGTAASLKSGALVKTLPSRWNRGTSLL